MLHGVAPQKTVIAAYAAARNSDLHNVTASQWCAIVFTIRARVIRCLIERNKQKYKASDCQII
jgi:hypothetical protein